jgi:flagellar protein FlbD
VITLTKLNDEEFILNCDLIETVEVTPDTVIALTTGKKIAVKEPPRAVVQRVVDFRRRITLG